MGTTNIAEIDQKIWDYNDDFNLGKVNYVAFLTAANPQAMPDPDAPIPTLPSTPPHETTPTPSQEPEQTELTAIISVAIVVAVLGVSLGLLIYLIKRK